jgi:hypothetical protein
MKDGEGQASRQQVTLPDLSAARVQGRVYRPNVVRVGSEEAPLSARARDVWVDSLIKRYLDMQLPGKCHLGSPCCCRGHVLGACMGAIRIPSMLSRIEDQHVSVHAAAPYYFACVWRDHVWGGKNRA